VWRFRPESLHVRYLDILIYGFGFIQHGQKTCSKCGSNEVFRKLKRGLLYQPFSGTPLEFHVRSSWGPVEEYVAEQKDSKEAGEVGQI
jgi:hypothetical protein